jgi:hypothetical protein
VQSHHYEARHHRFPQVRVRLHLEGQPQGNNSGQEGLARSSQWASSYGELIRYGRLIR